MKLCACTSLVGFAAIFLAPFVSGQAVGGVGGAGGAAVVPTPTPVTLVWVTITGANGIAQTIQTPYTQSFSTWDGQVSQPQKGTIGLGTIQGEIGVTKTIMAKRDVVETGLFKRAIHNLL